MLDTVTFILGLALGVLLLGDLAVILARLRWFYWIAPRLRPVDQTRLNVPPPDALKPTVEALSALGFARLGEAGLPEHARLSGPVQIWYFADREHTTIAGTFVTNQPHVIVYSWFGEQAVIVTAYPIGDRIEEANYRYHTVSTSLSDTYRHHLAQIPDFKTRYGPPESVEGMDKILQLDKIYNQKFSRVRGRPTLWRTVGTSAFQLYLILVLLGTVIAIKRYQMPSPEVIAVMVILILMGIGLYMLGRQKWG